MADFGNRFWTCCFTLTPKVAVAYVVNDGGAPSTWKTVHIEADGVVIKTTVAPGAPLWMRGAGNPAGNYVLCAQNENGQLSIYDSVADSWALNGGTFGQRPVGVGWNGTNFVIICQDGSTTYRRLTLGVGETSQLIPGGGTSQGLLQVVTAGTTPGSDNIRWTDPNRFVTVGSRTLILSVLAGGVYCGQWAGPGCIAAAPGFEAFMSNIGPEDPQFASTGAKWVAASWGLNASQFITYAPPWPNQTNPPPPPPVDPPGQPGGGRVQRGRARTGQRGGAGIWAPSVSLNTARERALEALPRNYHETDMIGEPHTQRMGRLLWDIAYDNNDMLKATDLKVGSFQERIDALEATLIETTKVAEQASAAAGKLTSTGANTTPVGTTPTPPGTPPPPGEPPPPLPPGEPPPSNPGEWPAQYQSGFFSAGPTGHVTAGVALDMPTVGQIIGGVMNEFIGLLQPTVDPPTRDSNVFELTNRVIWHLRLAGFDAGNSLGAPFGGDPVILMPGQVAIQNFSGATVALAFFNIAWWLSSTSSFSQEITTSPVFITTSGIYGSNSGLPD